MNRHRDAEMLQDELVLRESLRRCYQPPRIHSTAMGSGLWTEPAQMSAMVPDDDPEDLQHAHQPRRLSSTNALRIDAMYRELAWYATLPTTSSIERFVIWLFGVPRLKHTGKRQAPR